VGRGSQGWRPEGEQGTRNKEEGGAIEAGLENYMQDATTRHLLGLGTPWYSSTPGVER
jgi:hypothetical protein